jgi:hypothetical protein
MEARRMDRRSKLLTAVVLLLVSACSSAPPKPEPQPIASTAAALAEPGALPDEATLLALIAQEQLLVPSTLEAAWLDAEHLLVMYTVSPFDEWWEQRRRAGEEAEILARIEQAREECYAELGPEDDDSGWERIEAEQSCDAIIEGPEEYLDSNQTPCEDLILAVYTTDGDGFLQLQRLPVGPNLCSLSPSLRVDDLDADGRSELLLELSYDDHFVMPATGARQESRLLILDAELQASEGHSIPTSHRAGSVPESEPMQLNTVFELSMRQEHPIEESYRSDFELRDLDRDGHDDITVTRVDWDPMGDGEETVTEQHWFYQPSLDEWVLSVP